MFSKRNLTVVALLALLTLLVSVVSADDGRINRAPYHFGGDTLFCNQEDGCTLLNKDGKELANWPQDSVATAFATVDVSKQNTQVDGEGQGTYGLFQLWAVTSEFTDGSHTLCLIGFDEWGKQNDMCFEVTKDFLYYQAPLATGNSCDGLSVGMYVWLKADHKTWGRVYSIDLTAQTVTFAPVFAYAPYSGPEPLRLYMTAPCGNVEPGSAPL